MANTLANLARQSSTTTGTGTLTLGPVVQGFNTFAAAGLTDGQTVTYAIEDYSSDIPAQVVGREIGQGVYSAGTVTRTTVYSSTNGGSKINCSGRQHVLVTAAAEDLASFATDLTAHLNDTADAHDASAISFSATGGIASTDVQAAIAELDSEKLSTSAAASTYQPLDADLTTLAANITTFGHSLVDDADNTAARTTLGLGTAAVQNTGTSGATLPFLNGTNTWSAAQTISLSTSFAIPMVFESTNADANAGPYLYLYRNSATAAASDRMGTVDFRGNNTTPAVVSYANFFGEIVDATPSAESGRIAFATRIAGAGSVKFYFGTGLYSSAATGGDMGSQTINVGTLYENGTSLAAKYQGLDSELTAIAGLTSAADRLPYFTGSGTASLATFTTAGRNLVDDADASAQRTTLGLGTAATQNTGTSGATIPLLNAANTFSANQVITTNTVSSGSHLIIEGVDDSANPGPGIAVRRGSASPAAGDPLGFFNFQGRDSGGTNTTYASFYTAIIDPTDTSEDGRLVFSTTIAGTLGVRFNIANGFYANTATGGDKGAGTINATAVYDDSVLLCAPVEYMKSGTVNTAMWDGYAIDIEIPASEQEDLVEIDVQLSEPEIVIERQRDGTFKRVEITSKKATPLDAFPVLNDKGEQVDTAWVPQTVRKVTPAKTIKRQNELAHEFKAMLDEGFDPRDPKAYFDKMLADEALPGLKTKANWVPNEESNAKRTNRIILALELQTAVVKTLYERLEALEKKVKP